ncbi:MAG: MFS transporter [Anaerolineae bacterium]|nr:MAG: MFS transporter [Anaerolineae bacterium]
MRRIANYLVLNAYFVGLTTLSQTMTPLVLPLLVQRFAGEGAQGALYGNLRLWGLMTAVLVQPTAGMLSDRYRGRWGRRRPFILLGTLLDLGCIAFIGRIATMDGMHGYAWLMATFIALMVSSNIAHGPQQALIPDLVPQEERGMASGVKALLEVPLPLVLVAFTIGPMVGNGHLHAALLTLSLILVASMGVTLLTPEQRPSESMPFPWERLFRLAAMTTAFTISILGSGALIKTAIRIVPKIEFTHALWGFGLAGILAMGAAITVGVRLSIRAALGAEHSENNAFSWWVVNRLAFLTGATNMAGFALYFFQGRLGFPSEKAALPASRMLLVVGVCVLLTVLPAGRMADRWSSHRLMIFSGLLAASGSVVLLSSTVLWVIYLGAVLVGAATGIFYAANWAQGTRIVQPGEEGRYLGIANLAGAGAGAVGAYIGGPIADYFTQNYPEHPASGYVLLFGLFGSLFLLSILAALRVEVVRR